MRAIGYKDSYSYELSNIEFSDNLVVIQTEDYQTCADILLRCSKNYKFLISIEGSDGKSLWVRTKLTPTLETMVNNVLNKDNILTLTAINTDIVSDKYASYYEIVF